MSFFLVPDDVKHSHDGVSAGEACVTQQSHELCRWQLATSRISETGQVSCGVLDKDILVI